jgi:hypothetical protein
MDLVKVIWPPLSKITKDFPAKNPATAFNAVGDSVAVAALGESGIEPFPAKE